MKNPKFLFLLIAVLEMNTVISQTKEINSMDSLTNLFIAHNCFNGEALVTKNNKPIYSTTVGFRDNTFKEKISQNSIFNIGSISKPFTSVAILQLQQKKLLNIEDNVKKYIPNFPYDSICIKHLLIEIGCQRNGISCKYRIANGTCTFRCTSCCDSTIIYHGKFS